MSSRFCALLGTITSALKGNMSGKCLIIVGSLCFSFLTLCVYYYVHEIISCRPDSPRSGTTLSFQIVPEIVCEVQSAYANTLALEDYISMGSFLQASEASKDQDIRLSGLAVLSKLTNASQPLVDVRKSRIHVDKIALVIFKDPSITAFSCGDLLLNAQNAGYSVLIYFGEGYCGNVTNPRTQEEKLIPFASARNCVNSTPPDSTVAGYDFLNGVDKTIVNIKSEQGSDELRHLEKYLEKLYYWFLLGPVITLEWLRRKKKLCCMTTSQPVVEESAAGNEESAQLLTRVEESREENIQDVSGEENEDDLQPLTVTNNTDSNLRTSDDMRCSIVMRLARTFGRIICYSVVGLGYTAATLAALPVGISSGGWSFFRFDENQNYQPTNFWEVLFYKLVEYLHKTKIDRWLTHNADYIVCYLIVWWPLFQIFCFFMYSGFHSANNWTVSTNFLKLIRSDWFSSNMYLLVLCVIIPYCSHSDEFLMRNFIFFTVYNLTYTVCNFFFIIILDRHKIVTRYVFYISVCMICAYVESDIVAVFYFILNSQGALNNLKLTALRTVALGLTLTLSFSSSMHIIRKLLKPQESLFEGLSEK